MSLRRRQKLVLIAWAVAGSMDILCALTYYPLTAGARPVRILQGIASGVLGARAFTGGAGTAALGLSLHYLIALVWTLVFFLAARRFRALSRRPIVAAVVYGVVVWLIMNLVVLPLSAVRQGPFNPGQAAIGMAMLIFCIGLPIALIVGRAIEIDG